MGDLKAYLTPCSLENGTPVIWDQRIFDLNSGFHILVPGHVEVTYSSNDTGLLKLRYASGPQESIGVNVMGRESYSIKKGDSIELPSSRIGIGFLSIDFDQFIHVMEIKKE